MKTYRREEVFQNVLVAVTCDCCKKEYDEIFEIQEFLHYENDAGYGSIFGDGNRLRLDLCQHCTKKLLGEFIRVEGNYIWGDTTKPQLTEEDFLPGPLLEEFSSFKDDKPE